MRARRLLVATRSAHKLAELRALLQLERTELLSLDEVGIALAVPEDGATFDENAGQKALAYARLSGLPTLADDSGLEVDALGGGPGVRTRRYAGPEATDEANNAKLLGELVGLPPERRAARYRCTLAFVDPGAVLSGRAGSGGGPRIRLRHGTLEGRIATAPRGSGGFGYDPIFEPAGEPPGGRTVAMLGSPAKNRVSHRGRAARAMRRLLVRLGY
ncbi:MAG: hypothetical protein A2X23_03955 [Chloroflexi bacterium GWC2_73_18]|nr:MAG: hypothetical protein A2X23_03955 [Chloroflexi bacterium GWC2_73_18]